MRQHIVKKPGNTRHAKRKGMRSSMGYTHQEVRSACLEVRTAISAIIHAVYQRIHELSQLPSAVARALRREGKDIRGVVRIKEKRDGVHIILTVVARIIKGIKARLMTIDVVSPPRSVAIS